MPPHRLTAILAAACLAFAAGDAAAQVSRYKIEIQSVRVGFEPGPTQPVDENAVAADRGTLYKSGAWTPIFVRLTNVNKYNPDPKKDGPAVLLVETPDCDDTISTYSVPVPAFDEEEGLAGMANVIAYTRTGGRYSDFKVRVVAGTKDLSAEYKVGQQANSNQNAVALDPNQGLYLAIGSRLPGLQFLEKRDPNQNQPLNVVNGMKKSYVALAARVVDLPPVWFGYSSADLVVLGTSDRDFALGLVNDRVRATALAEWVRRGGRIVVCAGANADVLTGSPELNALLPVDIGKPSQVPGLQITWKEGAAIPDPLPAMSLAGLAARDKRGHRVLVEGPQGTGPVVVQGAYGLGRVTVVALDPDKPPVTKWPGQTSFWQHLLAAAGPSIPDSAAANQNIIYYRGVQPATSTDNEQNTINSQLEQFEGVPVISFGWVALFILLYILVVGPLDYLFLKKVVKRLELTWITFPTIVLAVSAAAYFTAYHLKGKELRVNKLDLVDIDQQTGRAYGRTWFAVFSPRIDKYTIGVEPAAGWAGTPDATEPGGIVSWFGTSRSVRENIFRQSYDYAPRAAGMRGVPIQVWSLKGFESDWAAPLDSDKPLVENRLRHPIGHPNDLIGEVTSRLPAALEDVVLIYRGEVASLGTMLPETPKTVTAQVRTKFATLKERANADSGTRLSLLFHEAWVGSTQTNNGSLRDVDQSWRLNDDNKDEVILVGRLEQTKGRADDVSTGPASPSRLWLGKLPTEGGTRPELPGTMRQDTIVRIFLPLTPERR
jgi:hypothetical protein